MRVCAAIVLSGQTKGEGEHDKGNRALFLSRQNKHPQFGAQLHLT